MAFNYLKTAFATIVIISLGCKKDAVPEKKPTSAQPEKTRAEQTVPFDTLTKTIHIFVALCDNKYQGIVPVPAGIGNGQDPNSNLYWGCGYGIRTYFKKSKEWKFLRSTKSGGDILERIVFRHAAKPDQYLVADAYDGQYIKQCTQDFLNSSAGKRKDAITIEDKTIGIGGNAQLLGYIGHDGLMDFELDETYKNTDKKKRDVIILACFSKMYFGPHLEHANVDPLVWTSHLMAPEAYTIHDAITGYLAGETNEQIRTRAAKAYNTHQKCGEKAARKLFITGW
ncbi:hypothetical protein [Flavobacterium sp.]|uniref:hypothetical protein n=1 Tax=Flavobacterium sp. TaxID=239 RepID=UPI004033756E